MMARFPCSAWLLLSLACLAWAPGSGAELVVFTHGGYIKVTHFEVEGDSVRLEVLGGGALRVPLLSVERILEDERPTATEPEVPPAPTFEPYFHSDQPRPETPFGHLIYDTAQRHFLNPALVAAVVRAESAFDPRAVSPKGAQGLMQLMPATGHRFGLAATDAFDAAKNLDAGVRYLRWLVDRFEGRLAHALAAYNAGEGTVDRYGGVPPYGETRRYLRRIFTTLGLPVEELEGSAADLKTTGLSNLQPERHEIDRQSMQNGLPGEYCSASRSRARRAARSLPCSRNA